MAKHISNLGAAMRKPMPRNDVFERVTGEKQLSLIDVLESSRLVYSSSK